MSVPEPSHCPSEALEIRVKVVIKQEEAGKGVEGGGRGGDNKGGYIEKSDTAKVFVELLIPLTEYVR